MEDEKKVEVKKAENVGAFEESLLRNNRKIREDRARTIIESTKIKYKRLAEDLQLEIDELTREAEGLLDLSPTNAQSLVLASDFNVDDYIKADTRIFLSIRDKTIRLEIAKDRLLTLFNIKIN